MKLHHVSKLCLTVCFLYVVAITSGCAFSLFPKPGALADKDSRIKLIPDKASKGSITTDDLTLSYELSCNGQEFTLNEVVTINQSISYSFEKVKSFVVKMSFLDEHGMVLDNVDVTPHFAMFSSIEEKLTLTKSGDVPAGSTAVAFSWYGSFYSGLQDMYGSWDIHYFPFERPQR